MEAARDLLARGNVAEALAQVNGVLARDPRNVEALLLRSTLRTRDGESALALADAEEAVRLSNGSAESQLRRAISLWRLQEYGKAKGVAPLLDDSQAATMWKSMIQARSEPEEAVERVPAAQPGQLAHSAPQRPLRTDWYQSGDTVHVVVYRKGLDNELTHAQIDEQQIAITSSDFEWKQRLGHSIARESSAVEITPYKAEFALRKKENIHWGSLESDVSVPTAKLPSEKPTPQTSYSKWEHIDDEDEDEKQSGDPDAFFQSLYKSSSPEVQRAMMKSFVESNGTALSTNWDEVKKGKVETHPPKDMEARSWDA